jgi:glycosyltransferase A (GT-A) superfamily protein (DUF2064 family)
MKRGITVSLSEDAEEALRLLVADGSSTEHVIEQALIEYAARVSDRQRINAEISALATDLDDRAEIVAVTQLMEMLLVSR